MIPSCAPAIISETFSIAASAVRAERLAAWARGSISVRRAEISANSAPTKKALATSRNALIAIAVVVLMLRPLRAGERG